MNKYSANLKTRFRSQGLFSSACLIQLQLDNGSLLILKSKSFNKCEEKLLPEFSVSPGVPSKGVGLQGGGSEFSISRETRLYKKMLFFVCLFCTCTKSVNVIKASEK